VVIHRLGAAVVLLAGCATPPPRTPATCPSPFAADPDRERRLAAYLAADPEAADVVRDLPSACFGPTRSPGVLVDGRPMLDARAQDEELAARLAHLGVHVKDDLGDGCKRGRARAIASESRARAVETRLRARAGLGPAPDDARESVEDYGARCDQP
jgi:hypothetical protein